MSNYLSGYNRVPCKNSTSDSGFDSYNCECNSCFQLSDDLLPFFQPCTCKFKVQGDDGTENTTASGTVHQVTTEFDDDAPGESVLEATSKNWYTPTNTADSDLKDFLSRPVNIASYTTSVGVSFNQYLDPWTLYFKTANIQYKLHNYAFISCDLKVKIIVNGSPFYYGAYLLSYNPLKNMLDSAPIDVFGNLNVPFSQRPHHGFIHKRARVVRWHYLI